MHTKLLVGITGSARSGKGEAEKILQKYYEFQVDSFAAPIRQAMIHILGLKSLEELESIKDRPHPILNFKTPRFAMQTMGTEWGRVTISDNLWIDSLFHRVLKTERVVISDVRFDNEAAEIVDRGGVILKVVRPGTQISESSHASESGIDPKFIGYTISNDESLDSYHKKVHEFFETIVTGV